MLRECSFYLNPKNLVGERYISWAVVWIASQLDWGTFFLEHESTSWFERMTIGHLVCFGLLTQNESWLSTLSETMGLGYVYNNP